MFVDEEVESFYFRFLVMFLNGNFVDVVFRFNVNILYSGVLYVVI